MKDDILQNNWYDYLKQWKKNKSSNAPTEDKFWVWYALNKMKDEEKDPDDNGSSEYEGLPLT